MFPHLTSPDEPAQAPEMTWEASVFGREEQFRTIFEHLAIGVGVLDMDGHLLLCNPALQDLFGYTHEELRGKPFAELTHHDDHTVDSRLYHDLISGRRDRYQVEKRYLRKDSMTIWGRATNSLIKDDDGQPQLCTVIIEDITDRKRAEEELRQLLYTDELTGLYNRRGLFMLFEQQVKLAIRKHHTIVLIYADIDGMKIINDTHGHAVGDFALIETANIFRDVFRNSDILARIGGDEFVALAIEAPGETFGIMAHRLDTVFGERNARVPRRFMLDVSWGMAIYDPEQPQTIQEMLIQADLAMYTQKVRKYEAAKGTAAS